RRLRSAAAVSPERVPGAARPPLARVEPRPAARPVPLPRSPVGTLGVTGEHLDQLAAVKIPLPGTGLRVGVEAIQNSKPAHRTHRELNPLLEIRSARVGGSEQL